jgi:hypothetical protein
MSVILSYLFIPIIYLQRKLFPQKGKPPIMGSTINTDHFTKIFSIQDTAVALIDHQIGTCGWVHSIDAELLQKNVGILATFATKMKMPLVLTSSM